MHKFALAISATLLAFSLSAHEEDWHEAIDDLKAAVEESMAEIHELKTKLHTTHNVESLFMPARGARLGVLIDNATDGRLIIAGFVPGTEARLRDLAKGDVLVGVDGHDLTGENASVARLLEYLHHVEPRTEVTLAVERGSESLDVAVETYGDQSVFEFEIDKHVMRDSMPGHQRDILINPRHSRRWDWLDRIPGFWRSDERHADGDLQLIDLNEDLGTYFNAESGVLVLKADKDSKLKPGDVIVSIGDREVASTESLFELLQDGSGPVTVKRNRKTIEISLDEALDGLRLERKVTIFSRKERPPKGGVTW